VRGAKRRWLDYSPALAKGQRELKEFLYRNLYYHPHVVATTEKAERILEELWHVYRSEPSKVPQQVRAHFVADGEARAIADYVAGMTDRFALAEHRRLTHGRGLD
jgi:dGTPase